MHIAPDCGIRGLLSAVLIVFAPVVCADWLSDQQEIMGTGVRVELWQDRPAKGQAVDRSITLLQTRGIKQAIVTAGGDSRIIGD
ncbi:MAG: FAD:protein FMN transferase [Acidiferrobacterales bacterium]